MGQLHLTPQQMGAGFQTSYSPGRVTVRGCGDTLTMAGMLAVCKALGTYFSGVSGGTQLGGFPSSTPIGGLPNLPTVVTVSPAVVQVGCKAGDETTLLASLVTAITTAGNFTATGSQKQIPGPVNAWGD